MIEISISSELAAEHPRFMAGCAERGHQVNVFEAGETVPETESRSSEKDGRGENRPDRSATAGRR